MNDAASILSTIFHQSSESEQNDNEQFIKKDYSIIVSDALFNAYANICKDFEPYIDGETLAFNKYIIDNIIERCLKDFKRISNHHEGVKNPDIHKTAAYLTYWVCKLRPIQILDFSVYDKLPYSKYIVELHAVLAGCAVINAGEERKNGESLDLYKLKPILADMFYILKYCNQNPDLLGILYYFIDKS